MPRQIDLSPQNLSVNNDPNNQLGFTQEQVVNLKSQIPIALEKAELEFINAVLQAIDQSTGLDLEKFTQEAQAGITYTGNLATDLWNYFVGTNTTATEANILATQAWNELVDFFETGDFSDLTTAMQSIFQAIFGSSTSLGLVGSIPAPAVVNVTQDIQPVFDFPDAQSVSAGGQWSWDGTVDHTGVTGSGSAKCVANGLLQALKGIPGAVQSGQIVTASGRVQWSGLTYTGTNPVQIQLVPYSQVGSELVAGTPFEVAQLGSPASSGSWTYLSGTYTVPSSGVDAVQLRLVVAANATAGSVWFDDCECNVSGGYLATLQNDLTDLQTDSTASTAAFATFITSVESAISSYTNWSTFISAIESAWVTYSTAQSALTSSAVFTLQNFFNTLLGISPTTGLVSGTKVSSSTGLTSLQDDWNATVASLENTWNSLFGSTSAPTSGTETISQEVVSGLTQVWDWLTGTTTPVSTTQVQSTAVSTALGGGSTSLGADVSTVHTTAVNGSTWSTRLTNDLTTLLDVFHVTYTSTQWNAAWADLLSLFGIVNSVTTPTNPVPTIGPSITSAQSSATTAGTNAGIANSALSTLAGSGSVGTVAPAQINANIPATKLTNVLGGANLGADVSTVSTTAGNGTSWATRLTNDLTVTSDVFHLVYQVGSSGDAPGTLGTNGKPTWYSAWNDILALNGVVNSVTAPTDPAPTTGASITAAAAAATTAGTNASMALSNAAAANTLAQGTIDGINQAMTGVTTPGQALTTVVPNLTTIPATNVVGTMAAAVTWGATGTGYLNTTSANPKSGSETHSPATGDGYVLAQIGYYGSSSNTYAAAVTYNGVAMTQLATVKSAANSAGGSAYVEVWALKTPPTGAKTVAATVTATGSTNVLGLQIISVSYAASKIGAVNTFTGAGGTTFSMSQASSTNNRVFGVFGTSCSIGQTVTFTTSGGQTQRYNGNGPGGFAVCSGDAPGASSVPFSGTSSQTISGWCGITVELSN